MSDLSQSTQRTRRPESFLERHAGLLLALCLQVILIALYFMYRSSAFATQRADLADALSLGKRNAIAMTQPTPLALDPERMISLAPGGANGGGNGGGGTPDSSENAPGGASQAMSGTGGTGNGGSHGGGGEGAAAATAQGGFYPQQLSGEGDPWGNPQSTDSAGTGAGPRGESTGQGQAETFAEADDPTRNPFREERARMFAQSNAENLDQKDPGSEQGEGQTAFDDLPPQGNMITLDYARELGLIAPSADPMPEETPDAALAPDSPAPAVELPVAPPEIGSELPSPETPPPATPMPPASQRLEYPSDPDARKRFEEEHAQTLAALKRRRQQMQEVNELQAIYGSEELESRLRGLRVDQIAEQTLFTDQGPSAGVVRHLEVGDVPPQELQKVYERYNIRVIIADSSRLNPDPGYLSGATTSEGTFANVTGAGLMRVFSYGPAAVAQMARLEEAKLRERGLNPLEHRVTRVIFHIVPTNQGYDLAVQRLDSVPVPKSNIPQPKFSGESQ